MRLWINLALVILVSFTSTPQVSKYHILPKNMATLKKYIYSFTQQLY